ncbi:MAG: NAD-dependent epimerase/dehydratase family protein [Kiritimatiellae bacterium]|nr:NAD-dependent epimerase/dehydratase family protein [Kiritimatiellia bacterium]
MKILVTGANGFVGTNLCRHLAGRGHSVLKLDVSDADFGWGDLDRIPYGECDAAVHLAGKAHDLRKAADPGSYFEINVGLTEKIFGRAVAGNPRMKFIYFSSSKAATAETPYGRSKLAAEKFLAGRAVVLRPAMIHGPGNKGNLNLLWAVAGRGLPWPLAAFENRRSFTAVGNLCPAVEALCLRGVNGVYPIADDETVSTNRLIELMAEARGRRPRLWRLPKGLMKFAAAVGDRLHLPLDTERLGKLTEDSVVDNSALKKMLGWERMPVRAEDGMRSTFRSFMDDVLR